METEQNLHFMPDAQNMDGKGTKPKNWESQKN